MRLIINLFLGLFLIGALSIAPRTAEACKNMGPNTHAGVIQSMDLEEASLTLIDAESGQPITFSATPEQLATLKPNDRVIVVFHDDGERLIAEKIRA